MRLPPSISSPDPSPPVVAPTGHLTSPPAPPPRLRAASAHGARFEGADFEKKDLGGVLAKFKARFEELPAPPPKDVQRRRGSTGRPQPIAVSLEELEDMIGVRGREGSARSLWTGPRFHVRNPTLCGEPRTASLPPLKSRVASMLRFPGRERRR